jgi:hypothetical protein
MLCRPCQRPRKKGSSLKVSIQQHQAEICSMTKPFSVCTTSTCRGSGKGSNKAGRHKAGWRWWRGGGGDAASAAPNSNPSHHASLGAARLWFAMYDPTCRIIPDMLKKSARKNVSFRSHGSIRTPLGGNTTWASKQMETPCVPWLIFWQEGAVPSDEEHCCYVTRLLLVRPIFVPYPASPHVVKSAFPQPLLFYLCT